MNSEQLEKILKSSGQGHLYEHYLSLKTAEEKASFTRSIEVDGGDLNLYKSIFVKSMNEFTNTDGRGTIEPPAASDILTFDTMPNLSEIESEGFKCIANGQSAVLILAGGSGTRLGLKIPKGMLVCHDLIQQKSLFQLQCEKILSLQKLASSYMMKRNEKNLYCKIQLVYMTSTQTDEETRSFFEKHNYFGLAKDQVHFFVQSAMPCCDLDGKILLASATKIATAPGGNAGVYSGLVTSGVLEKISSCGVKYVQIFTVDNILSKLGDPLFTGYAARSGCEVVVKAVPKISDHEAVGVFAKINGKWGVVEYTEIGKKRAEARDPSTGRRLFDAGHICINLCTVDFLRKAGEKMKSYTYYHIAKKPIPTINGPIGGVKLEAFIFDLFEFVPNDKLKIISIDRREEFSAIKNADDSDHHKPDSPYTAVKDLQGLHFSWILRAAKKSLSEGSSKLSSEEKKLLNDLVFSTEKNDNNTMITDKNNLDLPASYNEQQLFVNVMKGTSINFLPGIVEISPLSSYAGENIDLKRLLEASKVFKKKLNTLRSIHGEVYYF